MAGMRGLGLLVGVSGVVAISAVTFALGPPSTVPALLLLVPIAVSSVLAGWRTAGPIAVFAGFAFAFCFLPPIGHVRVGLTEDVIVLVTFVAVAVVVSVVADHSRKHRAALVDEQRAMLLRSLSHDLRTPLSTIRSVSSELLGDMVYDDGIRHTMLGLVVDESTRMDRIVGNLLSLTRVQAGALTPALEVRAPEALVSGSVARVSRSSGRSIELAVDRVVPDVLADPVQIDQVLTNLLENAVRHGPPGTAVTVRVSRPDRSGGPVRFDVVDQGPGFPADALASPFAAFRSTSGSLGLGLAVSKAIVESHGGRMWLERHVAGGAAVAFTLPAAT